jgi:hypothetical protein
MSSILRLIFTELKYFKLISYLHFYESLLQKIYLDTHIVCWWWSQQLRPVTSKGPLVISRGRAGTPLRETLQVNQRWYSQQGHARGSIHRHDYVRNSLEIKAVTPPPRGGIH